MSNHQLLKGNNKDIFLTTELSCGVCQQTLKDHLKKYPRNKRYVVYYTKKVKIKPEQLEISTLLEKERLIITNEFEIIKNLQEITNNVKGVYKISIVGEEIIEVLAIN